MTISVVLRRWTKTHRISTGSAEDNGEGETVQRREENRGRGVRRTTADWRSKLKRLLENKKNPNKTNNNNNNKKNFQHLGHFQTIKMKKKNETIVSLSNCELLFIVVQYYNIIIYFYNLSIFLLLAAKGAKFISKTDLYQIYYGHLHEMQEGFTLL